MFTPQTHPELFRGNGNTDRERFVLPPGWELVSGADTGTFYTALSVAFAPNGQAFVVEEFPNYTYVSGTAERNEGMTIPQWSREVTSRISQLGGRNYFWADPNSQFKQELKNYGMTLLPAKAPVETRSEIAREYFQHGRIFLAPWLTVLPFELENASWPEEASLSGKFARLKDRDHVLDCLEHILARRPQGKVIVSGTPKTWTESMGYKRKQRVGNVHMGRW